MSDKKRIYLHPTPVRIWHWLNALGIITLCITGVQIRFPEFMNICGSYRAAILLHNTAGIVVALSFSIWFFYYSQVTHNLAKIYVPDTDDPDYRSVRAEYQKRRTAYIVIRSLEPMLP